MNWLKKWRLTALLKTSGIIIAHAIINVKHNNVIMFPEILAKFK